MQEFEIEPYIRSGNKDVDSYIQALEDHVSKFDTSSVRRLITSLDNISARLSEDIELILVGDLENLTLLKDDKESKVFDRVMALVTKVEQFKSVSDTAISLRPKTKEWVDPNKKTIKVNRSENIFEEMQEEIHKLHGTKKKQ